jgi:hypothetical protein
MKVRIVVGLGLGIGITLLSGCALSAAEANAPPVPPAAAPTPLLPEAYTALSAPVGSTASPVAEAPVPPPPAAASAVAGRAVPSPAIKSNQYHPYWVVDVH